MRATGSLCPKVDAASVSQYDPQSFTLSVVRDEADSCRFAAEKLVNEALATLEVYQGELDAIPQSPELYEVRDLKLHCERVAARFQTLVERLGLPDTYKAIGMVAALNHDADGKYEHRLWLRKQPFSAEERTAFNIAHARTASQGFMERAYKCGLRRREDLWLIASAGTIIKYHHDLSAMPADDLLLQMTAAAVVAADSTEACLEARGYHDGVFTPIDALVKFRVKLLTAECNKLAYQVRRDVLEATYLDFLPHQTEKEARQLADFMLGFEAVGG